MIWGARNQDAREPFKTKPEQTVLKAGWAHTEDGWSLPLWRCPPQAGATGEPIILAADLCLGPQSMDFQTDRSLVRYFHQLGYDVFVFGHRGVPDAVAPRGKITIDYDNIVQHDVPAAIGAVRAITQARRVHWVGHGFGGQCLIGHLANDGHDDLASGALLSTPVKFRPHKSMLGRVARIARFLPEDWRLPVNRIQEILTVASRTSDLSPYTLRVEGPVARGLLMDTTTDIALGLIHQLNQWHQHGHLTDTTDRFDYLEGLAGSRAALLVVASPTDTFCSPEAARPVFEKLASGSGKWLCLPEGWGHLDLIAGADASRVLFPQLGDWLQKHDERCWTDS